MKDFILGTIAVVGGVIGLGFALYALTGFLDFLFSDPFNWINGIAGTSDWDYCVNDAKYIFDNFNDTVGASYALGDSPSTEVQNFMRQCLEERANLTPPTQ